MYKSALLVGIFFFVEAQAQSVNALYPHNYTFPQSVPQGCLFYMPSFDEPPDVVFYDEVFDVINIEGDTEQARVRVWRIGCHEPDRSAIALHIDTELNTRIQKPLAFLRPLGAQQEETAFLALFSGLTVPGGLDSIFSALQGPRAVFPSGVTYIVAGAPGISDEQYNGDVELRLEYVFGQEVTIPVFSYEPSLDPTQMAAQPFTGRHSGQWIVGDLPSSGLLIQIGEIPGTDRNFIFAIWFTYIDGFPTWVVGNTDFPVGANEIEIQMLFVENGQFVTEPGSYTQDDIEAFSVGNLTVRANHCNEIEADVDFGDGAVNYTMSRLIRIAGYDCDQTQ